MRAGADRTRQSCLDSAYGQGRSDRRLRVLAAERLHAVGARRPHLRPGQDRRAHRVKRSRARPRSAGAARTSRRWSRSTRRPSSSAPTDQAECLVRDRARADGAVRARLRPARRGAGAAARRQRPRSSSTSASGARAAATAARSRSGSTWRRAGTPVEKVVVLHAGRRPVHRRSELRRDAGRPVRLGRRHHAEHRLDEQHRATNPFRDWTKVFCPTARRTATPAAASSTRSRR